VEKPAASRPKFTFFNSLLLFAQFQCNDFFSAKNFPANEECIAANLLK